MRRAGLGALIAAGLLVVVTTDGRAADDVLGPTQLDEIVAGGAARTKVGRLERLRLKLEMLEKRGASEKARQRLAAAIARLEAKVAGTGGKVEVEAGASASGDRTSTTTTKRAGSSSGSASASASASSTGGRSTSASSSASVTVRN